MKKLFFTILIFTVLATFIVNIVTTFASEDVFHGGDIIYTRPVKAVLFSHKNHVEDIGLSCSMCHNEIFKMASTVQNSKDFNMKALYDSKYCGVCHNGTMAFASSSQCARCHIGVKGYNAMQEKEKRSKK